MLLENLLTIISPPIPLRELLVRTIVCILNYRISVHRSFFYHNATQNYYKKMVSTFCTDIDIKLVFTQFKIRRWFGVREAIPTDLRLQVIYKFSCAGCSACYVGETNRHFATRVREHLSSDKHSHIFKHLRSSENCRSFCSEDCFQILYSASTSFQLHILWEQTSLNPKVKHLNLSLSYQLVSFLSIISLE